MFDTLYPNRPAIHKPRSHSDVISSCSFNPIYAVLATCSGQRRYETSLEDTVLSYGDDYDCSVKAWSYTYLQQEGEIETDDTFQQHEVEIAMSITDC